eukprot:5118844-Amphidinium_carterae.1
MDQSVQSMSLLRALLSAELIALGAIRVSQKGVIRNAIRISTMRNHRKVRTESQNDRSKERSWEKDEIIKVKQMSSKRSQNFSKKLNNS